MNVSRSILARYKTWSINVDAEVDTETGDVVSLTTNGAEDDLFDLMVKVRLDGNKADLNGLPLPRGFDARLVFSKVNWTEGKMEALVEFSDLMVPFGDLMISGVIWAAQSNYNTVNLLSRDVIGIAVNRAKGV